MATGSKVIKKLKTDVGSTFDEIRKALKMREKLLLRQIDVIATQSQNSLNEEIKFIPDDEIDLMECIRSFGKFNLSHLNFANDLYVNEDYICPSVDHETMYKCLNSQDEVDCKTGDEEPENKEIVVDFFNNKIFKENINNMNESIVNITLNEAKELIGKTKPNLMADTTNNNGNEKIAQSSQTELLPLNKCKKPNITINNCNGTINLKNISNLTINCNGQTSIQAGRTGATVVGSTDCTESDLVSSSTVPSDDENPTKDNENNSVNCEFYNRLIKEIKNSLKQHNQNPNKSIATLANNNNCFSSSDSNANDSYNRKLLLKNFENLKIVLENNENDTHPIQIEQWLTEIISETEIEPMQNTEILEHSKLGEKELCQADLGGGT